MTKLYYQTVGASLALAIEGDNETEIKEQYYSLYNHCATNGELMWLNYPRLAYIYTNKDKLQEYLVNSSLFTVLNKDPDKYKKSKRGALPEAEALAKVRFSNIQEREIFSPLAVQPVNLYRALIDYDTEKLEPEENSVGRENTY